MMRIDISVLLLVRIRELWRECKDRNKGFQSKFRCAELRGIVRNHVEMGGIVCNCAPVESTITLEAL